MQPGATALRFLGKTVTWADLRGRVAALAGALIRRGVGHGDRVMILMLNRTEFVESVLAANMIGAIAVPINFRLTPAEIAFLVEDCEARLLITESVLSGVAVGVRTVTSVLNTIVVAGDAGDEGLLSYQDLLNESGDPARQVDVPNDSPALIMYTSGTTGRPKGAVLTHTNLTGQTMTNPLHPRRRRQRRRLHRSPALPHRRNRQPIDRTAARAAHGDPPAGRIRPWAPARRPGSREGHRDLPGPRPVAGRMCCAARRIRATSRCG